jgi:pyruvate formate lyase activating enzyme
MIKKDACIHCGACIDACPQQIYSEKGIDRTKKCIACQSCVEACPRSALRIAGEDRTITDLMKEVMQDQPFYLSSGGGLTLGGGEMSRQPEAAVSLLMEAKRQGVNTAIETCGYTKEATMCKLAECTDLFLFDIKHMDSDEHLKWTGVRNEMIIENLKLLFSKRANVKIRIPLLRDINDDSQNISRICEFLSPYKGAKNFKGIDLLPYHKLGVGKYSQLDMFYPLEDREIAVDDAIISRIENQIKQAGIEVQTIRH